MAYQDLVADLTSQIDSKSVKTLPFLQASILRQLRDLSSTRSTFMEGEFSFTTTALQNTYTAGYPGFPLDLMEIDALWAETGTPPQVFRYPIDGPVPIKDVTWDYYVAVVGTYPYLFAWHHQTLIFAPVTQGAVLIRGEYLRDATLDSATGLPITTSSTTATNPWFDRGYEVLRNSVLAEYYMSIAADQARATFAAGIATRGLQKIEQEWSMHSLKSAQAPRYMGDIKNPYWLGVRR